eukprot:Plantae.Rhodophyta-Hildenbrandia_rubra.ctg80964.p1 GENE.Plantae.Rhodophyta-Hildenbrandia_rubra.ctg80964~~Plantae.Rhodophyta-Hildenbrandia_rubra.ctg80964.p1  ORF type:complete len:280 (+),score=58.91 Plantae.Rhodophyta-Hildenbrandia_rubra.ctg80964:41-841(+)
MHSYTPQSQSITSEAAWVTTSRGSRIPIGYIPCEGARFTVLFSHGNAESLGQAMGYGRVLSRVLGVNFCGYEYSGYGVSIGDGKGKKKKGKMKASEKGTYADVLACYEWLKEVKGCEGKRVVVMGRSVGSGPSVWLCSRKGIEVGGLIVVSGFLSVVKVGYKGWVPRWIDMYGNWKRIEKVRCLILTVHGTEDEVIPFEHGVGLVECNKELNVEPYWIKGKGHNTAELDDWRGTFKVYKRFLERIEERQRLEGGRVLGTGKLEGEE